MGQNKQKNLLIIINILIVIWYFIYKKSVGEVNDNN